MTLITTEHGIYRFALNDQETLALSIQPPYLCAIYNQTERWALPLDELNEIRIENQSQLYYQHSPHQDYLAELMEGLGVDIGYCVDIGAYDGLNHSHTFPFIQKGWKGLAVEYNSHRFSRLAHVYRLFEEVALCRQKVTPANVVDLLKAAEVPQNFELLSLDIDSYDYHVLAALLESFRPTVICAEVNEVIPPPVKFSVDYDPDFAIDFNERFYGQSLAMLQQLCQQHNYAIVKMYYMDVFLIDRQFLEGEPAGLDEIYREGLLDRPRPDYYSNYPFDVEAVLRAEPEAAAELIRQGFGRHAGKFSCEV